MAICLPNYKENITQEGMFSELSGLVFAMSMLLDSFIMHHVMTQHIGPL